MEKKSKKKLIIVLAVIAVIVLLVISGLFLKPKNTAKIVDLDDTTVLKIRDIEKTISGVGVVESSNSTLVYSTLGYLVEKVNVSLGDYVEKGDLLAVLEDDVIQNQITSAQLNLNQAETSLNQQVEMAQTNYDNFVYALENNLNTTLNSAKAQKESAFDAYESAKNALESYKKNSPAISAAKAELDLALQGYKNGTVTLEKVNEATKKYDEVLSSDPNFTQLKTALEGATKAYNAALVALESVENSLNDQLEAYETALKNAKDANTDAAEESLRQLKVSLNDTKIKAPVSGTVTAVYAKEGASGSGLLFVIEDTENLIISTDIKGYDIDTLKEGVNVQISTEAIDDKVFNGVLTLVAPTANKTQYGTTDSSKEPLFAAEIEVTTKNSGLRIGMDADLDYIIEAQKSILAVPYDAVFERNGQNYVIVIEEQSDNKWLLKEVSVNVGMDDDLDIVVSGDIREGMRVLNNADGYIEYIGQKLESGTIESSPFPFPMG